VILVTFWNQVKRRLKAALFASFFASVPNTYLDLKGYRITNKITNINRALFWYYPDSVLWFMNIKQEKSEEKQKVKLVKVKVKLCPGSRAPARLPPRPRAQVAPSYMGTGGTLKIPLCMTVFFMYTFEYSIY
jgi:hypothetical protein